MMHRFLVSLSAVVLLLGISDRAESQFHYSMLNRGGEYVLPIGPTNATTAINCNNDGDYLRLQSADYPASTSSFSFTIWARRTSDRNTYNWVWAWETPAGHSTEWTGLMLDADGTTLYLEKTSGHVINLGTMPANTWQFYAVSINGTSATVWRTGEGGGALTKSTSNSYTALSNFGEIGIGASVFHASEFFVGDIAMARAWNGQLTDIQALNESRSVTPVKIAGIKGAWPLASAATATNATYGSSLTDSGFSSYTNVTGPVIGP